MLSAVLTSLPSTLFSSPGMMTLLAFKQSKYASRPAQHALRSSLVGAGGGSFGLTEDDDDEDEEDDEPKPKTMLTAWVLVGEDLGEWTLDGSLSSLPGIGGTAGGLDIFTIRCCNGCNGLLVVMVVMVCLLYFGQSRHQSPVPDESFVMMPFWTIPYSIRATRTVSHRHPPSLDCIIYRSPRTSRPHRPSTLRHSPAIRTP